MQMDKPMKIKIIVALSILLIFLASCYQNEPEEKIICGGIGGTPCPNGYFCTDIPKDITDGTGICKKIDLEKAEECLKTRNVTVVCSTEFNCSKQRELLGNLFQYLNVKYDNELTNCSKAGLIQYDPDVTRCEYYNDTEYLGWIVPNKPPYRGTRPMDQVLWIAGCKIEAVD